MSQNSEEKRIHGIWRGMKQRCQNPNCHSYKNYGGRGINICDEWLDFENFYEWALSSGYQDELQIDRINNDGNYEPSNCRWVTPKENARNKRNNRYITIDGETRCISEWCEKAEFPLPQAYRIIEELGEEAFVYKYLTEKLIGKSDLYLSIKVSQLERRVEKLEAQLRALEIDPTNNGEFFTIKQATAFLHCSRLTITRRIEKGVIKAYKLGRTWRIPKKELIEAFDIEFE